MAESDLKIRSIKFRTLSNITQCTLNGILEESFYSLNFTQKLVLGGQSPWYLIMAAYRNMTSFFFLSKKIKQERKYYLLSIHWILKCLLFTNSDLKWNEFKWNLQRICTQKTIDYSWKKFKTHTKKWKNSLCSWI